MVGYLFPNLVRCARADSAIPQSDHCTQGHFVQTPSGGFYNPRVAMKDMFWVRHCHCPNEASTQCALGVAGGPLQDALQPGLAHRQHVQRDVAERHPEPQQLAVLPQRHLPQRVRSDVLD